jgi:glycosyltransferase involved in cell wall biosynthesis
MKVAHVLFSGVGGVFNVVNSLIKDKDKKYAGIYVGPKLSNDFLSHKKILKNNFYYVKTIRFLSSFFFPLVAINLIKFRPDIIVLHNYQILGCILAKLFINVKIIYVDHTPLALKSYKDKIIIKCFNNFIDKFVVLNNENLTFFYKKLRVNKEKIVKIYNGISVSSKKKINKNKKQVFTVGMAGRLNNTKHFDILIDSIQSILNRNIKIKCLIAGEGENEAELKNKVIKKNKNKIIFCGLLDQKKLENWYKKLDLYVQASKGEAMSISILQAMLMKVPVIGSNVSGIKNLQYPNSSDSTLFLNKAYDLENKIISFIKMKKKKKEKIINKQLIYVNRNFTEKMMLSKYNNIYNSLLK